MSWARSFSTRHTCCRTMCARRHSRWRWSYRPTSLKRSCCQGSTMTTSR
jgi:hypothetical protein